MVEIGVHVLKAITALTMIFCYIQFSAILYLFLLFRACIKSSIQFNKHVLSASNVSGTKQNVGYRGDEQRIPVFESLTLRIYSKRV